MFQNLGENHRKTPRSCVNSGMAPYRDTGEKPRSLGITSPWRGAGNEELQGGSEVKPSRAPWVLSKSSPFPRIWRGPVDPAVPAAGFTSPLGPGAKVWHFLLEAILVFARVHSRLEQSHISQPGPGERIRFCKVCKFPV